MGRDRKLVHQSQSVHSHVHPPYKSEVLDVVTVQVPTPRTNTFTWLRSLHTLVTWKSPTLYTGRRLEPPGPPGWELGVRVPPRKTIYAKKPNVARQVKVLSGP
jgi:hypothetical protein